MPAGYERTLRRRRDVVDPDLADEEDGYGPGSCGDSGRYGPDDYIRLCKVTDEYNQSFWCSHLADCLRPIFSGA
jgi:hypothetical protein